MKIDVENCDQCRMGYLVGTSVKGYLSACRADSSISMIFLDAEDQYKQWADEPPKECPLRQEPLTISLRKKT